MAVAGSETVYDDLVVGGGIAGMTMALLLGGAGRRVLLIEKQSTVGGCMRRFRRGGVPFDTGFHFTGGFGGLLSDMLRALDLDGDIRPVPLAEPRSNRIYLEDSGTMFDIPPGLDAFGRMMRERFPGEGDGIDGYLNRVREVERNTPFMDLRRLNTEELFVLMRQLDEDAVPLQHFLDRVTSDRKLQTVLAAYALCYGSPPSVTPLSAHCRASVGMHASLARVEGGGDAFIRAFRRRAGELGIEVRTGTEIAGIVDRRRSRVHAVRLTDGSVCRFENAVLAIHPREMLRIMPDDVVSDALRDAVAAYQESLSFFSLFATVDVSAPVPSSLTSYLTCADLNAIIGPDPDACAMAILTGTEETASGRVGVLCAFESEFPGAADRWKDVADRRRDPAYQDYKRERAAAMVRRIERVYPEYAGHIRVLDTASTLTFADYVPPFGSAYGIMHKVGETSLFGRLPLRNFYAVGQSSLLPGVVGAMLSSFIVARCLLGRGFLRF